jgi:hypothetical protein
VPLLFEYWVVNVQLGGNFALRLDRISNGDASPVLPLGYHASFPVPWVDLLLLCKVYAVERVALEASLALPPPPLQILSRIIYNVVVVLWRLEDVVLGKRTEGPFVRQPEMCGELAG